MSTEELLKPRIKIIAPWPQNPINPFHVGDILLKNGIHFTRISNPKSIHEKEIDIYPHLFRKLDWWEERKLEDMPEYVKQPPEMKFLSNTVFKIDSWDETASIGWCSDHCINVRVDQCTPATKEDFLNQQNDK